MPAPAPPPERAAPPAARPAHQPADPRGARPVIFGRGDRRGVNIDEATLVGGFWHQRQRVNATATLVHCHQWMEKLGWIANFDRVAAGTMSTQRPGWVFSDSEVYKLMEALSWEHGRSGDPGVEAMLVDLTHRVGAAQDDDGYLDTAFGHDGRPPRWSDLESGHELYCMGHLMQAGVARARTAPADDLVMIARRVADHVCDVFGPDGRDALGGHPEIELGLVELGRALDEPRWIEQARLFLDRRGHGRLRPIELLGPDYFQDDVPVRDAVVWRGHAVRALYLGAATVDIAVDLEDVELLDAVTRQWDHSVQRRTHLTGGMGSRHQDEGFGQDWELSPDRAYCETCAGVASVMVSWRLYLATGDVRYADLMERTLFNVVATSPRADGRAFFYANPLSQREVGIDGGDSEISPMAQSGVRAPWFDVSCCPTNVARTFASWCTYTASVHADMVSLLQYATMDLSVALDGGRLGLAVRTDYPVDGEIAITVTAAPEHDVTLRLRIPAWADGAQVIVDGRSHCATPGWHDVEGRLEVGTVIVLSLPIEPRITRPDPRIDALRGTVAAEAGPIVLCLESTDLPPGVDIANVRLDVAHGLDREGDGASARATVVDLADRATGSWSYGPSQTAGTEQLETDLVLVPYHRWAERRPSTMRVWIPTTRDG